MDIEPLVNIIMSSGNRPNYLKNTLYGWSRIDYQNFYFTLIDNGSGGSEIKAIADFFSDKLLIDFHEEPKYQNINRIWNKYGKRSGGEYIVFAMADEIISHGDILQKMMETSSESRVSIFTYFLNEQETQNLKNISWQNDPTKIPKPYTSQTSAGLISHIIGNYRDNWEYFGWFRDDVEGHLWIDQDVHLRELILGPRFYCRTPSEVYCFHQYHLNYSPNNYLPGYVYKTEAQARLLEPAERDI